MKKTISLSEIEWQLMRVLWDKGVMSVREVWQALYPDGEKAYTTVQTYMDRMVDKKLLKKQKIGLVNFYQPIIDEQTLRKQETERLVFRAFNGSFGRLAAFLVDSSNLSKSDLEQIKQLIKKKERK